MNDKVSSLSGFVAKLDNEILNEEEAILLKGGFSSTGAASEKTEEEEEFNFLCNTDNCDCSLPTDDCKAHQ